MAILTFMSEKKQHTPWQFPIFYKIVFYKIVLTNVNIRVNI